MVPVTNIGYDPKFGLVVGVITALYALATQRKAKTNFHFLDALASHVFKLKVSESVSKCFFSDLQSIQFIQSLQFLQSQQS